MARVGRIETAVRVATMMADSGGAAAGTATVHPQGHVKITSCIGLIALSDRLWDELGA